jgi:hypothetical protein
VIMENIIRLKKALKSNTTVEPMSVGRNSVIPKIRVVLRNWLR